LVVVDSRERKRLSVDEERISRGLHDDDVLSGIWECQVDLGRCLCEQCVRDLIDLLGVLLEVRPLRTHNKPQKRKKSAGSARWMFNSIAGHNPLDGSRIRLVIDCTT